MGSSNKNVINTVIILILVTQLSCNALRLFIDEDVDSSPDSLPSSTYGPIDTETSGVAATVIDKICPIEDISFCDFTRDIEPFVEDGDFEALLNRADLKDCYEEGGAWPEFDPESDCPPDDYCLHWGIIQGEGGCTPTRYIRESWGEHALGPRRIFGLVFPGIPDIGLRDPLDGPVVLIGTGDEEFNLVLFCKKYEGRWKISAILLQRISAAKFQTPPELIAPWP